MKAKDPEAGALLPVLERIAGALERIGDASQSMSRMADTVERLEALAQRYERLQRIAIWNERYATLETIITPDKLETMKVMIDEFVLTGYRVDKFQELGVEGFETWLRKILTIQRIYEYFLLTKHLGEWSSAVADGEDQPKRNIESLHDEDYAVVKWLHELVWDRDFRMVHLRQGAFYPRFSELVNLILLEEAKVARREKQKLLADEMEQTTKQNTGTVEFDRLHALSEDNPERVKTFAFIKAKGGDPFDLDSFLYIWVTYPGWSKTKAPKYERPRILTFHPRKPKK